MIYLDCSGIYYGSPLDETHLFKWAQEIPCFVRWDGDTLVVRSRRISRASLRELLALFSRYDIPMAQLAQFKSSKNAVWFAAPNKYWHKEVFGRHSSRRSSRIG